MDSSDAYELHASNFLRGRDNSSIGSDTVGRWARTFDKGASILELGCGGGYPISHSLQAAGLRVWAVDSSPTLVSIFKSRFPDFPIQCIKVQESAFFNQSYDGAIAIGLVFLLPEPDQATVISNIAKVLLPGGRFLLTAPIENGKWIDVNTGMECSSLGQAKYEHSFRKAGLRVNSTFTDSGNNNYYDLERVHRGQII